MLLTFAGFPHSSHYRGSLPGVEDLWEAGEERDLPKTTADYLMATFPRAFAPAHTAMPAPAPVSVVARGTSGTALEDHWRRIVASVEAGEHDDLLDVLLVAEREGRARASILRAIEARIAELG